MHNRPAGSWNFKSKNIMTILNSRFAKSNGAVNYNSRTALTLDQVRNIAPSIFAEDKHGSRSSRYTHVPTMEVLERVMREGFQPFSIMQGGSRDESKRGFTKHVIRLRHESTQALVAERMAQGGGFLKDGPTFPEIVLLNSHDGSSSYRMSAGLFRLACSNGLIVSAGTVEDVIVPHKGDIAAHVVDGCIQILGKLPTVQESVDTMKALTLSEDEQRAFASAALIARYGEDEAPIKPENLLTVRREADRAPSLWNTLNRTQEAIIRGGVGYVQRDDRGFMVARRRTRPINGIDQNTNVNRALWALAEAMQRLKA